MAPAVRIENLSKQYRIGALQGGGYRTLRETLMDTASAPWTRFKKLMQRLNSAGFNGALHEQNGHASPDTIWAVNNVSFDVDCGEVVGIIGRNGAGKSTLLKILSHITEPTCGRVVLNGRVASLLEVGTGFHPELTGRENIYLNGAILGMSRREIQRKFDIMVDFSGIEQFLDTPVKRYSSGMYVRLAFAVAAHLDPEILVVDEVLAVGDAEFQKKCLGKMHEVAKGGRTVLFVSHNLPAVTNLCRRCILMQSGRVVLDGETNDVTAGYFAMFESNKQTSLDLVAEQSKRSGTGETRLEKVQLYSLNDVPCSTFPMGAGFRLRLTARRISGSTNVAFFLALFDQHGARIFLMQSADTCGATFEITKGKSTTIDCVVPEMNLMPGKFRINLGIQKATNRELVDFVEAAFCIEIVPSDVYSTGVIPRTQSQIFLPVNWSILKDSAPTDFETRSAS